MRHWKLVPVGMTVPKSGRTVVTLIATYAVAEHQEKLSARTKYS